MRKKSAWLLVAAVFAQPEDAQAQVKQGFAVNHFEPSERGSDWFANESLDLRGNGRLAFGAIGDYQYRPLATYDSNDDVHKSVVRNMLAFHVGGAVNLFDRLRLSASMPLVAFVDGHSDTVKGEVYPSPTHEQAIGDLRFGADVRLLGAYGDPFQLALGAQLWVPTGNEGTYTGDGSVRVAPRATVAGDISVFTYAAKVGFEYRKRQETIDGSQIGTAFDFSAAAGLRLANKKVTVGPEIWWSTVFDDGFAKRATPIEGVIGAHYEPVPGLKFGTGIGTGLTRGFGAPEVRALLGIEWMQPIALDRDGDGILDKDDACPDVKGIASTDPSKNGCPPPPPPPDRDHDGIIDADDKCPDVPGVPENQGCPADRDHDGIYDKDDACPDEKGVASSDPKKNGCPPDTDGDGILDKDDACPNEPGIKTSDPKTNGCPDPDRDKDGVPNAEDACPDEPGPKDADPKRNGCPKAFVSEGQIKILDQVRFKTNSAEIVSGKDSEEVLEAVQKVLKDHPEIKKVRVEGHTDNRGTAALNKKLSADRAASVVKWLTSHGIEKERLTSEGFGPDRPIAENTTDIGRTANRRVEFHIEKSPE